MVKIRLYLELTIWTKFRWSQFCWQYLNHQNHEPAEHKPAHSPFWTGCWLWLHGCHGVFAQPVCSGACCPCHLQEHKCTHHVCFPSSSWLTQWSGELDGGIVFKLISPGRALWGVGVAFHHCLLSWPSGPSFWLWEGLEVSFVFWCHLAKSIFLKKKNKKWFKPFSVSLQWYNTELSYNP